MNLVVCVKYVPDVQSDRGFEADDLTVDRRPDTGVLSELDEYAVEEALHLRETLGGDVTALTMGPEPAVAALQKALQMGADRAVHVCDPALSGSDAPATSLVLAAALRRLGPVDLVLTGMTSSDGGMSVVPSMLAERLGLPQLTFASSLTLDGRTLRIRRDAEAATEVLEAGLPAVLSVTDQINEPRYPAFTGIVAARSKPVQQWSLADIGVDPNDVGLGAAWSTVTSITPQPRRRKGRVVTDGGDGGRILAEFLAAENLV